MDSVPHQAGRETLEKHDGVNELWLTAISYYIGQKVYTNWYKSKVKFENQQNCAMNAICNNPFKGQPLLQLSVIANKTTLFCQILSKKWAIVTSLLKNQIKSNLEEFSFFYMK